MEGKKTIEGTVKANAPRGLVVVVLDGGEEITAHVADEFKRVSVPVVPGDRVVVKRHSLDPKRGSIVGAVR